MTRLGHVKLVLIVSMLVVILAQPVIAKQFEPHEPRQIVLTWQSDPMTTMTVTWRTDIEAPSKVYFSTNKDVGIQEYRQQEAETFTFEGTTAWIHSAELTALTPGETYWVVVETGNQKSEKFCFQTAPAESRDLVFVIGADAQHLRTQMTVIREVLGRAAQENPDAFIYSGDFVNAELSDYEWDLFFDLWHELMITDEGRRIPIIPAVGNHEVIAGFGGSKEKAPFYYNRFRLPQPEAYHVIQYGPNLTIISLDSNHTSSVEGEQLLWLENTLKEHQDSEWLLAHSHVGSWWGTDSVDTKIRFYWVPLFEKYQVDLVHSGHSHSYMRTPSIYGLGDIIEEIDNMIETGLARAKADFDSSKNYAPPLQKNLVQLSRGNWQDKGFDTITDALQEVAYMLSLFVLQTGEGTPQRVFDQVSSTRLYEEFWNSVLLAEEYDDLVDEEKGVVYLVGGGLGAELSPVSSRRPWWKAEARSEYHYRRLTLDSSRNELRVEPFFYYPDEERWEVRDAITISK